MDDINLVMYIFDSESVKVHWLVATCLHYLLGFVVKGYGEWDY
jgi:hypothetical protein